MGYLTLNTAPGTTTCRALFVPDSEECLAIVRGAIQELTFAYNWFPDGALTPQQSADVFLPMFDALCFNKGPCRVIGEIIAYAGNSSPNSLWLACDGSTVSQADFPDLYTVIGTIYGSAPAGQFRLPDLRGRSPSGAGSPPFLSPVTLGQQYGEELHTLTVAEMPSHSHSDAGHTHGESAAVPTAIAIGPGVPAPSAIPSASVTGIGYANIGNTGLSDGHNTIGPRLGITYLIVAKDG